MSGRRRFTLVELLVVVAILGVLAALLFPSLRSAKVRARKMACLSNMRQSLVGIFAYAGDYAEFPYSWQYGVAHTEYMSHHYMEVYTKVPGVWSNAILDPGPPAVSNQHDHMMSEGDGTAPYWEYYLLTWKYVATPDVIGCAFRCPENWLVWPASCYTGAGIAVTSAAQIRRAPPYVYRGPSASDDHRNSVYGCGQIAGGGSSDARFGGRSGAWYPHFGAPGKPKPIFHCPVFTDRWPTGYEYYASPHAYPYGVRKRDVWPMSVGWGRYGHYLDETVGWSDGRATLQVQPPGDPGKWFVNYQGEVVAADVSGF